MVVQFFVLFGGAKWMGYKKEYPLYTMDEWIRTDLTTWSYSYFDLGGVAYFDWL